MGMPDDLLTPEEAAEYLKIHLDSVRRLLRSGKLPGAKVGSGWRIKALRWMRYRKAGRGRRRAKTTENGVCPIRNAAACGSSRREWLEKTMNLKRLPVT